MEDYADIYYVDTRNADSRDHRTHGSNAGWRPSSGPANSPSRQVVVNPAPGGYPVGPYSRPMAYPPSYPMTYPGQGYPGQGQTALGSLFGGMPVGQILDLVATAFAALSPLPQAPTATRDTTTDVNNLVTYQAALADHAKRDERIRTLGSLVGKLVA